MLRFVIGATIILSSIIVSCSGEDAEVDTDTLLLTEETFSATIQKKPHFVMFFAPWCGHCKKLKPTWKELHESVSGSANEGKDALHVGIARVDCTKDASLCSQHSITGYPTLLYFKGDEEGSRYKGSRNLEEFLTFLKKQLGLIAEPSEKEAEGTANLPVMYTVDSFKTATSTGHHFVKFFAPWCGHCQTLAPVWDKLAESFSKEPRVTIAKVDCTQHKQICTDNGVRGYPTLLWFSEGKQVGDKYAGERTLEALKKYAVQQSMAPSEGTAKEADAGTDSTPSPPEPKSSVVSLTEENFDAHQTDGLTLIKFFAPWCGHCKQMAGAYVDLGTKFAEIEGVTVAEVDCTVQKKLCEDHEVDGFPTVVLYRSGAKVEEYQGDRSLADMASFITKHLAHEEL